MKRLSYAELVAFYAQNKLMQLSASLRVKRDPLPEGYLSPDEVGQLIDEVNYLRQIIKDHKYHSLEVVSEKMKIEEYNYHVPTAV